MLEMKKCCKVPFPEKLFEEYEAKDTAIYANVNASKVVDMMKRFIEMHDEPIFSFWNYLAKMRTGSRQKKPLRTQTTTMTFISSTVLMPNRQSIV